MAMIGYARIGSTGQSLDKQLNLLTKAGALKQFEETTAGSRGTRPALRGAIGALGEGDVLAVTRLDRLARSMPDLIVIVAAIVARGANLRSLGEEWADTSGPAGEGLLAVFSGLLEFERNVGDERTADGRQRVKGLSLGRQHALTAKQRAEALAMRAGGDTNAAIARMFNVHRSTISRLVG